MNHRTFDHLPNSILLHLQKGPAHTATVVVDMSNMSEEKSEAEMDVDPQTAPEKKKRKKSAKKASAK